MSEEFRVVNRVFIVKIETDEFSGASCIERVFTKREDAERYIQNHEKGSQMFICCEEVVEYV